MRHNTISEQEIKQISKKITIQNTKECVTFLDIERTFNRLFQKPP